MRLTVKPLKNRRPGSGMAVIDRTVLQDIGVSSGDFVELRGSRASSPASGPATPGTRRWPDQQH